MIKGRDVNPTLTQHMDVGLQVEAQLALKLFDLGIHDRAKAEKERLDQLAEQFISRLSEVNDTAASQREQHAVALKAFDELRINHGETYKEEQGTRDRQWEEFTGRTRDEQKNLIDAFEKFMQLKAPVKYWEAKQKKHFWLACGFGALTVISMGVAGAVLYSRLTAPLGRLAGAAPKSPDAASVAPAASTAASSIPPVSTSDAVTLASMLLNWDNLAHLASLLLVTTLVVWYLRLVVRIFLSHLHLEMDAAERTTMVTTYLALVRDGSLAKDNESLKSVLAALFRPTGDGIVKDEGLPAFGLAELLTRPKT